MNEKLQKVRQSMLEGAEHDAVDDTELPFTPPEEMSQWILIIQVTMFYTITFA